MVNVWFALGWTPPSPITPPDTKPDAVANMNFGILGGNVAAVGGGDSVAQVGSTTYWGSEAYSGNNAVTVHASAELLLVSASGYDGEQNWLSGGTVKLCDATNCAGTTQDFVIAADYDDTDSRQQATIWALEDPNTGSQYVVWVGVDTGNSSEGMNWYAAGYDNVDQTTPISDEAGTYEPTYEAAMISGSGDLIFCVCDTYAVGSITWANATEDGAAPNTYESNVGSIATNNGGSNVTVSVSDVYAGYTVITCVNIANQE